MRDGPVMSAAAVRSRKLAKCDHATERLFWRMLAASCDHGGVEADAWDLLYGCVPGVAGYDEQEVERCLTALVDVGLLITYTDDEDRRWAQVVNYDKHQPAERLAARGPRTTPAPVGCTARANRTREPHAYEPVHAVRPSAPEHDAGMGLSPVPVPVPVPKELLPVPAPAPASTSQSARGEMTHAELLAEIRATNDTDWVREDWGTGGTGSPSAEELVLELLPLLTDADADTPKVVRKLAAGLPPDAVQEAISSVRDSAPRHPSRYAVSILKRRAQAAGTVG